MRQSTSQGALVSALLIAMLNSSLALPVCDRGALPTARPSAASDSLPVKPDNATLLRATESYGKLPLSFEANEGQFDSRVKFVSRGRGNTVYLTSTEAVLRLDASIQTTRSKEAVALSTGSLDPQAETGGVGSAVLRMKLIGAAPDREIEGLDELPGKSNYFIGNDPKRWRAGVTSYSKVRYRSVYPGIDLIYHSNQSKLEYDFKVAPGANPRTIRLAFEGATRVRIDRNGELVVATATGEVRQLKPVVYQDLRETRKRIAARYVIRRNRQVEFRVAHYDRRRLLVIDPTLSYSTYLGGNGGDRANAVAVDASGSAYVTGSTSSTDFPTANPFQPTIGGAPYSDVFVTKLNPTGTALVYSTYLGDAYSDFGNGIALDSGGNAYITGQTSSPKFPTANPLQSKLAGQTDAFVTKLNPQGSMLVYSTFLGGSFNESGHAIAVDGSGGAFVTGDTGSTDFPLVNPLRSNFVKPTAFVSRLDPAGTSLVYSTYLGGSDGESGAAIALDSDGNAYVTGYTRSADFPTINALQPDYAGKSLFKSTDAGESWIAVNNGIPGSAWIWSLVIDPLSPSTIYAGTNNNGVFKTTDSGASWTASSVGLTDSPIVYDLAIDASSPSTVYAGTSPSGLPTSSLFKSTDAGASWSATSGPSSVALAIDLTNPLKLFAGNSTLGVFITTDGGATWDDDGFPHPEAHVRSLAIDPTVPGAVYVGTDIGVEKLHGGGGFFEPSAGSARCITVAPTAPSTVYAGTQLGGVFRSTNAGGAWAQINTGLTELNVDAIAVDSIDPSIIYAGTPNHFFKSTNGGNSWSSITIAPNAIGINEIVVDPLTPSTLYAGASNTSDAFITKLNPSGSALVYSTFLGGSGNDSGSGIAVDSSGSCYIGGSTASMDIPSAHSLRPYAGGTDVLLARLTPNGSALVFFTYLGGAAQDFARGISLDASGNAWITGDTLSSDFPTTPDAILLADPCPTLSCRDAFVSRINSTGAFVTYSTYLGGSAGSVLGFGVGADPLGDAYVVGETFATDFPTTTGAFQQTFGGGSSDCFIAKIEAACAYSLSATSTVLPRSGGSGSVTLTTGAGCGWVAMASDTWIRIVSEASGIGGNTINFEVKENLGEQYRIGALTIAGLTFIILQAGSASANCSFLLSPTNSTFAGTGGAGSVNVTTTDGCIWRAVSNTTWVRITSTDYGVGAGVVMYSVDANPSAVARKATITIARQTLAIKQKGNIGSFEIKP